MLKRTLPIAALALLCAALSAGAETLPEYVVTAAAGPEDAMSVPANVTVITADEIAASGKTDIVDVLEDVSGLNFRSYSTDAQAQVSMRGFGENSFGRVVVLVDGRELNNPDMSGLNWQSIPLSSIERIEVLDGPSAVLYGSGAVGGVINVVTKESSPGVTAGATISYGSFDTQSYKVSGGFGTDHAGFLLSADYLSTDGYRDRSAYDSTNVFINAFVDVTDKLTLKPFFEYADIEYQMPGYLTEAQLETDPRLAQNPSDDAAERLFGGGLVAVFSATDRLSIEWPLTYTNKDRLSNMTSWSKYTDVVQRSFGSRPKVSYSGDADFCSYQVSAGLDFTGVVHESSAYADKSRNVLSYNSKIEQYSLAPWVSSSLNLPLGLSADAGLRYDGAFIKADKDASGINSTDSYSALVYDLSIGYRPFKSLFLYAKYNTLFRYPFIDEKAQLNGLGDRFNADLVPETGWNVEAGVKIRHGDFFSATGTVYYLAIQDEIAYNPSLQYNVNLPGTRHSGASASVSVKPVRILSLDFGGNWVNSTFSGGENRGDSVSLVPAMTANAGADLALPAGFTLGAGASYTGRYHYDYKDQWGELHVTIDPVVLAALSIRFAPKAFGNRLALTIRADNVFDAQYAGFVACGYEFAYIPAYYPAEGRSFTVSVAYKY